MAKKKKDSDAGNKVLWAFGAAAVGAFTMYSVNKYMKDREELQLMKLAERQQVKAAEGE